MKKLAVALGVLFVLYVLFTQPATAADLATEAVGGLWGLTQQLFESVIDFIGEL